MITRRPRGAVALGAATCLLALAAQSPASHAATPADYPSCRSYWNRNAPANIREQSVNRCIVRAAREGRQARAVGTLTTVEGDPIANYVFVRGKRDVLVVVDSTRDAFGPRVWTRLRCTGLVTIGRRIGWTGCRPAGTGKPSWLVPARLGP